VETKCGDNWYVLNSNQRCYDNLIETKCGSDWYNTATSYCKNGTTPTSYSGSVTYGDQTYKTIKIGTQIWMAENLNYNANGSKCYNNQDSNCDKYGRLYNWLTAMALPGCNNATCSGQVQSKHQGICPTGWHIPSDADWNVLMKFVNPICSDNSSCAGTGTKLKAANGWTLYSKNPVGSDDFGFSALPGGFGNSVGRFGDIDLGAGWWSTKEYDSLNAYYRSMSFSDENTGWYNYSKSDLYSVRCLQD